MITQGDWQITKHGTPDYAPQYGIYSGESNDFCIVKDENAEDNAALIAAAPKLLAMCKEIDEIIAYDGELTNGAITVIKDLKALTEKAENK